MAEESRASRHKAARPAVPGYSPTHAGSDATEDTGSRHTCLRKVFQPRLANTVGAQMPTGTQAAVHSTILDSQRMNVLLTDAGGDDASGGVLRSSLHDEQGDT